MQENRYIITRVDAREILDSRGNPTVEVEVTASSVWGRAEVPSGASTGVHEAVELRDGDPKRFLGKGVLKAIKNVKEMIAPKIIGKSCREQKEIDGLMIELDGTKNKSFLGANSILGVSLANARCAASVEGKPLFAYLKESGIYYLPIPMMNVINGGKHAGNNLAIQEFLIEPCKADSFRNALRMGAEIYHQLKGVLKEKYGPSATNVGDEGGYAPPLSYTRDALDAIYQAVKKAGYTEEEVYMGIDAAASNFFLKEKGLYKVDGREMNSEQLGDFYKRLADEYPIKTFEDPFEEEAFEDFAWFTAELSKGKLVIGDDIFVTNVERIKEGMSRRAGNAVLIKPNQVGTLTETVDAVSLCRSSGWATVISHRSGETEDNFISHLAVATSSRFIKTGAPARGERVAKYNELIRIEELLGGKSRLSSP